MSVEQADAADSAASQLGMDAFDAAHDYFALTITANRHGGVVTSVYSRWVGWSERREGWEVREASLVNPKLMTEAWELLGHSWSAVHNAPQLIVFLRSGGHAIVEKTCAERWLPDAVSPSECVRDGVFPHGGGFLTTSGLPDDAATRRAPTRKLRMRVLKRDNYRCVICGRSPRNNVDIELELHHVIPWRMGGPTAEENLVTLCGTCHDGLDPDYEPKLRELADLPGPAEPGSFGDEYFEDLARYRSIAPRLWPGVFGAASSD
jgi:hypothetical protein